MPSGPANNRTSPMARLNVGASHETESTSSYPASATAARMVSVSTGPSVATITRDTAPAFSATFTDWTPSILDSSSVTLETQWLQVNVRCTDFDDCPAIIPRVLVRPLADTTNPRIRISRSTTAQPFSEQPSRRRCVCTLRPP